MLSRLMVVKPSFSFASRAASGDHIFYLSPHSSSPLREGSVPYDGGWSLSEAAASHLPFLLAVAECWVLYREEPRKPCRAICTWRQGMEMGNKDTC